MAISGRAVSQRHNDEKIGRFGGRDRRSTEEEKCRSIRLAAELFVEPTAGATNLEASLRMTELSCFVEGGGADGAIGLGGGLGGVEDVAGDDA